MFEKDNNGKQSMKKIAGKKKGTVYTRRSDQGVVRTGRQISQMQVLWTKRKKKGGGKGVSRGGVFVYKLAKGKKCVRGYCKKRRNVRRPRGRIKKLGEDRKSRGISACPLPQKGAQGDGFGRS